MNYKAPFRIRASEPNGRSSNQPWPIVALFFALGVLIKSSSLLLISSSVVKAANVFVLEV